MNLNEARATWAADRAQLEAYGVYIPGAEMYIPEEFRRNFDLAMDALPTTFTQNNAGIPAMLTTLVDPTIIEVLFMPTKAAEVYGEQRKGTWVDDAALFPVIEHTGEVSSYGDYNENGRAGVNMNWENRQSYLFQTIVEYGDRELERAGLAKIDYVAQLEKSAAAVMNRFSNFTYLYGVAGLQNFGILNDPSLPAPLTPATKAAGGVKWINNGVIMATANEVYSDVQALYGQLVNQTAGAIDKDSPMVLVLSPGADVALTATNSFNVSVTDLLKKNFPNLTIETIPQYGARGANNPQGSAAGEIMQLIVKNIEGQETGYVAYNEKMRQHQPVRGTSSVKKKMTGGTWGAIIRMPMAVAQMVGM